MAANVKDYSTPAIEQELTALDRRPGQVLDNTQQDQLLEYLASKSYLHIAWNPVIDHW
jgi:hypothetical protein